jgi:excisionase family DNA binding protein
MATVDPVDESLTPAEVAEMFGVNSKTVTRWADSERLGFIRDAGGRHCQSVPNASW